MIPNLVGNKPDWKKLRQELTRIKRQDIKIIEDSAEMIGQTYFKKKCGSFGDISTFSFYANKHITTGEGGMILTNDLKISNKCRSLRNLCFGSKNIERFNHDDIGWNYRMTNLQAAIGAAQMEKIEIILKLIDLDNAIDKKLLISLSLKGLL